MLKSHNKLVTLYVERDSNMKLDRSEIILASIKKLGYYNLNVSQELDRCIREKFRKENIVDISYNDYKKNFEKSSEYNIVSTIYANKIERCIKLAKYIGTNLNLDFYNDCTIDELYYLGY